MAQITTTDANEFSSSAEFTPMRGFSNCHLQTMLPRLFRRQVKFTPYWQRLYVYPIVQSCHLYSQKATHS